MTLKTLLTAGTALAALSAGAHAQSNEPDRFTFEDVFELEMAADPQISPDGETIVYLRRSNDIMTDRAKPALWRVDFDGANHEPLLDDGEGDPSGVVWSPDGGRLVFTLGQPEEDEDEDSEEDARDDAETPDDAEEDEAERPRSRLTVMDVEGGELETVAELETGASGLVWSPDGDWLAYTAFVPGEGPEVDFGMPEKPEGAEWADDARVDETPRYQADGRGDLPHGQTQIFIVPADGSEEPRALTDVDSGNFGGLTFSPDGDQLYFSYGGRAEDRYRYQATDIYAMSVQGGEMEQITDGDGPESGPLFSPDGSKLAYTGYEDRGTSNQSSHLYVMDLERGESEQLLADLDRSISGVAWDESGDGDGLWVQFDDSGKAVLARIDGEGELSRVTDALGGLSSGRPYTSGSFSVSGNGRYAATIGSASDLSNVGVGESGEEPTLITDLNEDVLARRDLGRVERITWDSSADGREIEGWIAYPPDFDPDESWPLLLEIHGGPHTAYGPTFAAEIQLFASAGYVVLYTNPRGSTSYGEEFANLIDKVYPDEDVDDLLSGVDAVVERGFIDENRLFVTGGSGGGVLTAQIIGTDTRFAGAAVVKPVINWTSFALGADIGLNVIPTWMGAAPWEDPDLYWNRSPLSNVGNVETPTLVMVGWDDRRTPPFEAEQFYNALQYREIESRLVRIPGAPHGIADSAPSRLIQKTGHILAWFADHDPSGEGGESSASAMD